MKRLPSAQIPVPMGGGVHGPLPNLPIAGSYRHAAASGRVGKEGKATGGDRPFSGRLGPGTGRPRAAFYLRVSKGQQTTDNQRPDVERIADVRGLELASEYVETASAARERPMFNRMLDDARRGTFKILIVWALDRFGRSMVGNLQAVLELDRIGVQVISVREPWLDTGGPVRSLLLAIFSWVAEQERARLGERTRAGLERARARGRTLGRPKRAIPKLELERARKMIRAGNSLRFVAKRLKVPETTLRRVLTELKTL